MWLADFEIWKASFFSNRGANIYLFVWLLPPPILMNFESPFFMSNFMTGPVHKYSSVWASYIFWFVLKSNVCSSCVVLLTIAYAPFANTEAGCSV